MSFLDDIADFSSDSSDEEIETNNPPTKGTTNRPDIRSHIRDSHIRDSQIREPSSNIHRLSNLDETLRNMPYDENYSNMMRPGNSSQSGNSESSVNRVRFSDRPKSHNNSDKFKSKIKTLETKIDRLHKIIKIKTLETRDMKAKSKTILERASASASL